MFCRKLFLVLLINCTLQSNAQFKLIDEYNITWNTQSLNAGESMPVGGGDIGLNVWVENNELFFYFSKSGAFDENNTFLRSGRFRLRLSPNAFSRNNFKQELHLKNGYATIETWGSGIQSKITIWVDVFNPVIHVDVESSKPVIAEAIYENWRFVNRPQKGKENNANSWKWASHVHVITQKDSVQFDNNAVLFYHRNQDSTVFDDAVAQQALNSVKNNLYNPIKNLTSGGLMKGKILLRQILATANM